MFSLGRKGDKDFQEENKAGQQCNTKPLFSAGRTIVNRTNNGSYILSNSYINVAGALSCIPLFWHDTMRAFSTGLAHLFCQTH